MKRSDDVKALAAVTAMIAMLALGVLACGGSSGSKDAGRPTADVARPEPVKVEKLPPVKPEAMSQYESGMRAIRVAGDVPSDKAIRKASEHFTRAAEIDGKLWEAWHNLGAVRYADGDDKGAVEAFSKALEVNPAHTESLLARAEAHRQAEQTKEARKDYEDAIARSSDDSPVKRNATARLASLLREARQYDDAVKVIRDTLRTAGANASVYVELALVYLSQGRVELAELVLDRAAKIDPKEPAVHNAFALLALRRGRSQEAFDRFDHATSLDPSYSDARFNKAAVLIEAGDYDRARQELEEVLEQNPEDLIARVALGVAQRGLGEFDKARKSWQRVVKRASRRTQVRGDALFNLAILQMSFLENDKAAAAALDRYLQEAPRNHRQRQAAQEKKKELGL